MLPSDASASGPQTAVTTPGMLFMATAAGPSSAADAAAAAAVATAAAGGVSAMGRPARGTATSVGEALSLARALGAEEDDGVDSILVPGEWSEAMTPPTMITSHGGFVTQSGEEPTTLPGGMPAGATAVAADAFRPSTVALLSGCGSLDKRAAAGGVVVVGPSQAQGGASFNNWNLRRGTAGAAAAARSYEVPHTPMPTSTGAAADEEQHKLRSQSAAAAVAAAAASARNAHILAVQLQTWKHTAAGGLLAVPWVWRRLGPGRAAPLAEVCLRGEAAVLTAALQAAVWLLSLNDRLEGGLQVRVCRTVSCALGRAADWAREQRAPGDQCAPALPPPVATCQHCCTPYHMPVCAAVQLHTPIPRLWPGLWAAATFSFWPPPSPRPSPDIWRYRCAVAAAAMHG